MKVGSIGYATWQGLGVLLKDFYDHGIVTDVMTVRHWARTNYNWYNGPSTPFRGFDRKLFKEFVKDMDVMFFFETPFDRTILSYCKHIGVKTILMPMYECTHDWAKNVDLVLNPSLLDQEYFPEGKFLPVPVPEWVVYKVRERARVFVHNAGHGGLNGRNGTAELLQAIKYVESPIKLIVRSQEGKIPNDCARDPRVTVRIGTFAQSDLYHEGDVFIFPEKFNGLSLPLQEAKASGMLVMALDRFPINTWTNRESLIPTNGYYTTSKNLGREVRVNSIDPQDIAATMDAWYDRDITKYSKEGLRFAEEYSWDVLGPRYKQQIEKLVGCVSST